MKATLTIGRSQIIELLQGLPIEDCKAVVKILNKRIDQAKSSDVPINKPVQLTEELLATPLENFPFYNRMKKAFLYNGLTTVQDLFNVGFDKLENLRGFGKIKVEELKRNLIA